MIKTDVPNFKGMIWSAKGGVGKTQLSSQLSSSFDSNVITNDVNQSLYKMFPNHCLFIPEINKENQLINKLDRVIFDLGGFVTHEIEDLVEIMDFFIVPSLQDTDSLMGLQNTLNELVRVMGVDPAKIIVIDNMKKKDNNRVQKLVQKTYKDRIKVLPLRASTLYEKSKRKKMTVHDFYNSCAPLERGNYDKSVLSDANVIVDEIIKILNH